MDTTLAAVREVAVAVAEEAGALLRERLDGARTIDYKGAVNLVTDADHASEALIAERIRTAFPDHWLYGEEGSRAPGAQDDGGTSRTGQAARKGWGWIFDPLDGTTNYAHGYPHFAVSIGVEHDGETVFGVVHDPMRGETFIAERGRGATLNGRPIRVSGVDVLLHALTATGYSYDLADRPEQAALWDAFVNRCQGTRRDGAAALNLVYVACGRLDGFWERPLQPWDMAAGALIVEEAGGRVSSYADRPFDPFTLEAIATNGLLHEPMLATIRDLHAVTPWSAAANAD